MADPIADELIIFKKISPDTSLLINNWTTVNISCFPIDSYSLPERFARKNPSGDGLLMLRHFCPQALEHIERAIGDRNKKCIDGKWPFGYILSGVEIETDKDTGRPAGSAKKEFAIYLRRVRRELSSGSARSNEISPLRTPARSGAPRNGDEGETSMVVQNDTRDTGSSAERSQRNSFHERLSGHGQRLLRIGEPTSPDLLDYSTQPVASPTYHHHHASGLIPQGSCQAIINFTPPYQGGSVHSYPQNPINTFFNHHHHHSPYSTPYGRSQIRWPAPPTHRPSSPLQYLYQYTGGYERPPPQGSSEFRENIKGHFTPASGIRNPQGHFTPVNGRPKSPEGRFTPVDDSRAMSGNYNDDDDDELTILESMPSPLALRRPVLARDKGKSKEQDPVTKPVLPLSSRKQVQPPPPPPDVNSTQTKACLNNVTDSIPIDELKGALVEFGPLKYFEVSKEKACAYVEFETPEAFNVAESASPFTFGNALVLFGATDYSPMDTSTASGSGSAIVADSTKPGPEELLVASTVVITLDDEDTNMETPPPTPLSGDVLPLVTRISSLASNGSTAPPMGRPSEVPRGSPDSPSKTPSVKPMIKPMTGVPKHVITVMAVPRSPDIPEVTVAKDSDPPVTPKGPKTPAAATAPSGDPVTPAATAPKGPVTPTAATTTAHTIEGLRVLRSAVKRTWSSDPKFKSQPPNRPAADTKKAEDKKLFPQATKELYGEEDGSDTEAVTKRPKTDPKASSSYSGKNNDNWWLPDGVSRIEDSDNDSASAVGAGREKGSLADRITWPAKETPRKISSYHSRGPDSVRGTAARYEERALRGSGSGYGGYNRGHYGGRNGEGTSRNGDGPDSGGRKRDRTKAGFVSRK